MASYTLVQFVNIGQTTDVQSYYLDNETCLLLKNPNFVAVLDHFNGMQASDRMLEPFLAFLMVATADGKGVICDEMPSITIPNSGVVTKISLILRASDVIAMCDGMTDEDFDKDMPDEMRMMQRLMGK